jgi:hypothetical protein
MDISTSNYEFAHGRKPSGKGYWAFTFWKDGKHNTEFAPGDLTYGAAKRWAIVAAKVLGADRVAVAS